MSELALPFLVLFHDDSAAFWAFEALMTTYGVRRNFAVDESGIFGQLRQLSAVLGSADRVLMHQLRALGAAECHFAYRMIVVMMRRDLPISQVSRYHVTADTCIWRQVSSDLHACSCLGSGVSIALWVWLLLHLSDCLLLPGLRKHICVHDAKLVTLGTLDWLH